MLRPRRRLGAHLRYLWALIRRFRVTVLLSVGLFGVVPLMYAGFYVGPHGERISYGLALHHVYFLLFGQPSLEYVDSFLIEAMNLLIPPVGIAIVVDGLVRFGYLYFAKHRNDKEWIGVISQALKDHVIVCGAGRVGYRVASKLITLGREVVVVDKNEQAAFVSVLRDAGVPVLIDNVKSPQALHRLNVEAASAIVCATDDDLANLNTALDARRIKPSIRVVIRLFDDDLVARVRDHFHAEAFSSSALAAPALALAALDPRIVHSFHVGPHLMVVSQFTVHDRLVGSTVSELRDRFGALTLSRCAPGGAEQLHPSGDAILVAGESVTLQADYESYLKLRHFLGEDAPPLSAARLFPNPGL